MEVLALIGGLIYIGALGIWVMEKIDRFIGEGGLSPYCVEGKESEAASKSEQARICGSAASCKVKAVNNTSIT